MKNNIVHRDIKPDNIFFSKIGNKAKIGDFTVCQQLPDPEFMLMSKAGTCLFMAPEIEPPEEDDGLDLDNLDDFDDLDDLDDFDPDKQTHEFLPLPTDIWSMGVTMFSYFNEECPFMGKTEYLIVKAVQENEIPKLEGFSDDLNDLLMKMCDKDPKARPSAKEILEHPWFSV
mmetsp:Transcript_1205/g.1325  ORF Transcript_1205/g.1325 Transcript_1205/m.1325 type:complete len:172 (-) Transcript_1205:16-531(-)